MMTGTGSAQLLSACLELYCAATLLDSSASVSVGTAKAGAHSRIQWPLGELESDALTGQF